MTKFFIVLLQLEAGIHLPPPNLLKRKIIIKNKKKHHHHHKKKIINIIPTPVVPSDILAAAEESKNPSATGDETTKNPSLSADESLNVVEEVLMSVTSNGETPVGHAPPLKEGSKER